mgnify:FL=1
MIWRKRYTASDLVQVMKRMGMRPGDVVFIHSAMHEFYNYTGTAEELILAIEDYLGPEGTLAMPAFPREAWNLLPQCLKAVYQGEEGPVMFDVRNTPTGAGYLAETFRKMPGVKRSINIQHSTCAWGKHADYLISEHHLSRTCWDEKSPYYKLTLLNAKVFSLGLPQFVGTVVHCTESMLFGKYAYFDQFFRRELKYNYIDVNGNLGVHEMLSIDIDRKPDRKLLIVRKYFSEGMYVKTRLSNLTLVRVFAKYTHEKFMELARQGIVMYSEPSPEGYKWDKCIM